MRNKKIQLTYLLCVVSFLACTKPIDITEASIEPEHKGCVIVVPDIQYYTNDEARYKYLDAIVNYCTETKEEISFLLQTGDVTNNNATEQWNNGYNLFFSRLPKSYPVVFCLGNHDYGENGGSAKRESGFPLELTPVRDIVMPDSKWDNYMRYVTLGDDQWAVLSLEFAPRNEVLEWADELIKANADIPFIILTHAFLNNSGQMFDALDPSCDNTWTQKQYRMGNDYLNDSKEIFDKIIYNNPNVKMVVCGHCVSKKYIECLEKKNAQNENVYCIMVNYQHYRNGGDGNIGLLYYHQGLFTLKSFNTVSRKFGSINIPLDLSL